MSAITPRLYDHTSVSNNVETGNFHDAIPRIGIFTIGVSLKMYVNFENHFSNKWKIVVLMSYKSINMLVLTWIAVKRFLPLYWRININTDWVVEKKVNEESSWFKVIYLEFKMIDYSGRINWPVTTIIIDISVPTHTHSIISHGKFLLCWEHGENSRI